MKKKIFNEKLFLIMLLNESYILEDIYKDVENKVSILETALKNYAIKNKEEFIIEQERNQPPTPAQTQQPANPNTENKPGLFSTIGGTIKSILADPKKATAYSALIGSGLGMLNSMRKANQLRQMYAMCRTEECRQRVMAELQNNSLLMSALKGGALGAGVGYGTHLLTNTDAINKAKETIQNKLENLKQGDAQTQQAPVEEPKSNTPKIVSPIMNSALKQLNVLSQQQAKYNIEIQAIEKGIPELEKRLNMLANMNIHGEKLGSEKSWMGYAKSFIWTERYQSITELTNMLNNVKGLYNQVNVMIGEQQSSILSCASLSSENPKSYSIVGNILGKERKCDINALQAENSNIIAKQRILASSIEDLKRKYMEIFNRLVSLENKYSQAFNPPNLIPSEEEVPVSQQQIPQQQAVPQQQIPQQQAVPQQQIPQQQVTPQQQIPQRQMIPQQQATPNFQQPIPKQPVIPNQYNPQQPIWT